MLDINRIHKLAFVFFGEKIRKNKGKYSQLQLALNQAHIGKPLDIYVSTAYFISIIAAIMCSLIGYILKPIWSALYLEYIKIIPYIGLKTSNYGEPIFIAAIILFISLIFGSFVFYIFIAYPVFAANNRKTKINLTLPHAVAYMHALSKGGLSSLLIFKSLSEHIDVYGEAAEEIKYIVQNTEQYGMDFFAALKYSAAITPSDKFRDFLSNLLNVTETGGDIEIFLGNMVTQYQNAAESEQTVYLEVLGMLAETYVTVFVAGPLFLITIFIVMGMMNPQSMSMLNIIIYLMIPLSAIAFSFLLYLMSVGSDMKLVKKYRISKKINHYNYVRTRYITVDDERSIRKFMKSLGWKEIKESSKKPLKIFLQNPMRVFYISVPAALVYFFISVYKQKITIDLIDDVIIIGVLITLVPFLLFYHIHLKRIKNIGNSVPGFLKRLAAISDMGMPLTVAIKSISKINLGVLSTEVKLMHRDIVWTNSLFEALIKFEHRINTISISRIVMLISKASQTTGNIKETLRVAARDADLAEKLNNQKFNMLFSYLIVIYLSFFVFMLVLYLFATSYLPLIPDTPGSSIVLSISSNLDEFSRLFMHASVIQGFFSGIIAGQMMGESVFDGLLHSVIMMTIAYVFFVGFL